MWKLAFRNTFRHRNRTALTLAAVMLGVAALNVSGGFVADTLVKLREATIHSQFGHIQVSKRGFSAYSRREPFRYMIESPETWFARFRNREHVLTVASRVQFSGLLSNGRSTFGVIGEGIDPVNEKTLSTFIRVVKGQPLTNNDKYGILIGQGVAQVLHLNPGDHVSLLLSTSGGALNTVDLEVTGVFQTFSKNFDDYAVRIGLSAAQELLGTNAVHKLVIGLNDTAATDRVAAMLRQELPKEEFEVKTWYQLADFYQKAVDLYGRYFAVLRAIILGLILLGVANSVNMNVYERTGEFGMLMALGNRRRAIVRLILAENLILGIVGSGAGVLLGLVLAVIISVIGVPMPPMPNTNSGYIAAISILPYEVAIGFLVGLIGTILASILPGLRASRAKLSAALAEL